MSSIPSQIDNYNRARHELGCNKDYWMEQVRILGMYLHNAPDEIRADKDVAMAAVTEDGLALEYVGDELKSDKEVVMAAVTQDRWGSTLKFATDGMKNDKDVVLAAVDKYGNALEHASDNLKNNREVVMAAVSRTGEALRFASLDLRSTKDIVLAAVQQAGWALKFALGGLNQDRECLAKAGLFDDNYDNLSNANATRAVMSTKFTLGENSPFHATLLALCLKEHPFFFKKIILYFPNSWEKHTCDPQWTNIKHPCRGTFATCEKPAELKTGVPKEKECCWRYSFRYQLEKARETGGFMIQVVEYNRNEERFILGNGQKIETEMAEQVGVKVFRVYEHPYSYPRKKDADGFVDCVKGWYDTGCNDMSLTEYRSREEHSLDYNIS